MKIVSTTTGAYAKSYALGRNASTRLIHIFGGGASRCGSSKRNLVVSLSDAQKAVASSFCDKCFPNGKPESFYEIDA